MSIGPINNTFSNPIDSTSPVRSGASTSSTAPIGAFGQDQVGLSPFVKLIQQLEQLQKQDPDAFKQELSTIASKLKDAAQKDTDPSQSQFLSNLADRFQKAADTGDLSALRPQQGAGSAGGHGGHHHHHHGGGAPVSAQTKDTIDSIFADATNATTATQS